MAVIAVGDLSVNRLEELTREYFGSIEAKDPPAAPDTNSPLSPEPRIEVTATPGQGNPELSLYLQIPVWDPTTPQGERDEILETLLANTIDIRLRAAYDQGLLSQTDPPVWLTFSPAASLRHYGTTTSADDLTQAVSDIWTVLLSLATQGFDEADLSQAKAQITSDLQLVADNVEVTQNPSYAFQYATHFLRGTRIETSPQRLERVSALLETIEPDELTSRLRSILAQSGPIISVITADLAQVPSAAEIQAVIDSSQPTELAPAEALIDELMTPPDPVEPITEGPITDLGFRIDPFEWSFANGARVNFSHSHVDGFFEIRAVSLGGWSTLEPGDRPLAEVLAPNAVAQSGIAGLTPAQIARHVRTTHVSITPFIAETTEGFTGLAPSGEAETLFAMLHLLICEARVDDQAFNSVITTAQQQVARPETDSTSQTTVAYNEARYGDQIDWFRPVASQEVLQPIDPPTEAILEVLEVVLNARLLNDIREDIGKSYSVSASLNPQFTPESAITSEINAGGTPESIDEIRDEIIRILADLATSGPTENELRSAISVVELNYSQQIGDLETMARRIHTPDNEIATQGRRADELSKLTAADVQALADELYGTGQHIEVARVLS